ncbi:hypothetical protein D3C75_638300 [compost metagenome]
MYGNGGSSANGQQISFYIIRRQPNITPTNKYGTEDRNPKTGNRRQRAFFFIQNIAPNHNKHWFQRHNHRRAGNGSEFERTHPQQKMQGEHQAGESEQQPVFRAQGKSCSTVRPGKRQHQQRSEQQPVHTLNRCRSRGPFNKNGGKRDGHNSNQH